jgi:hypothetical protein
VVEVRNAGCLSQRTVAAISVPLSSPAVGLDDGYGPSNGPRIRASSRKGRGKLRNAVRDIFQSAKGRPQHR